VVTIITFLGLNVALLQFSFYQTFLGKKLFKILSDKIGFDIDVNSIYLDLFAGSLQLNDFSIRDPQDKQMIYTTELEIDFDYHTLLKEGDINLGKIILDNGTINFIVNNRNEKLNISQFVKELQELASSDKPKTSKKKSKFIIQEAHLNNTYLSYQDETKQSSGTDFDPAHFALDELNLDMQDFLTVGDTIQLKTSFKGVERKANLDFKKAEVFFRLTEKTMEFRELDLQVNNTVLTKSLILKFDNIKQMGSFIDSVEIEADLENAILKTDDLALFAPALKNFKDTWFVNGKFKGKISDFELKNANVRFGKGSRLVGNIKMKGLPDIQKTEMDIRLRRSEFLAEDLSPFVQSPTVIQQLEKFGKLKFRARFLGNINDFNASGTFNSNLGEVIADIRLRLPEKYYKGQIQTKTFQLGKFLNREDLLGTLTMKGEVEGTGFTEKTAKLKLDAQVAQIELNNYNYQDLTIDGELGQQRFSGKFNSNDENFDLSIEGELDFAPSRDSLPRGNFNLVADIRKLELVPLNFARKETELVGKVEMHARGMSLDDIIGSVYYKEGYLIYDGQNLDLKDTYLRATQQDSLRNLSFFSNYFEAELKGDFIFSELINDLQILAQEYALSFEKTPEEIEAYYEEKEAIEDSYLVNIFLNFKNFNEILGLLQIPMQITPESKVSGQFAQNPQATLFSIYTDNNIDSLSYGSQKLYDVSLNVQTSKGTKDADVSADISLASSRQDFGAIETKNLALEAKWNNRNIDLQLNAEQDDTTGNYVNFLGNIQFLDEKTSITFDNSEFQFLNEVWLIKPNHEIALKPEGIFVDSLEIYDTEALNTKIAVHGVISDSLTNPLEIDISSFPVATIATIIQQPMKGTLNGHVTLSDLYQAPEVVGDLDIGEFVYGDDLIGNVETEARWNQIQNILDLEGVIWLRRGRNRPFFDMKGTIDPKTQAINLLIKLKEMRLNIIEPFAKGLISDVSGAMKGEINIKGKLSKPEVDGAINIINGGMTLDFLNTHYTFNDKVVLKSGYIGTERNGKLWLFDEFDNKAWISGGISHNNFQNILVNVKGAFNNFLVLDKDPSSKELFYGTAKATGSLRINGFLNNLSISVKAKNEKDTKISLPLDGYQQVSQKDYITFVQPKKDENEEKLKKQKEVSGLKINLDLDVTEEALFEIIFDLKAGDIIQGSGSGNIGMEVDTKGDFNMFGEYTIEQGQYNFTLMNLVNKDFQVKKGGKIQFNGDVFDTFIDLTAVYFNPRVSLQPILDESKVPDPQNPAYKAKFPINVYLGLRGKLLEPEITLDVDMEMAKKASNPYLQQAAVDLDNRMKNDDQERNRQVFSLIILRKLMPPNSFSGIGSATTSSLSEMLSNQLSNWVSQVDENLELTLDIDASQFSISYSLFNDRLRITRDGTISNDQTQSNLAAAIGDWTVEYLISTDGKLRAKVYNRNNQNAIGIANFNNAASTTAGFSLLYTQSFNNLRGFTNVEFKEEKKKERKDKKKKK